ncbi:MAG: helix-turn-helix domain-containing protein [Cellulosilyticaceae bacterium]
MKLNIGKVICELRKRDGVTQEKLAQALGVSVAAVSKWETGATYPDITILPALARYFRTTVDMLMGYEEICSDEELAEMMQTSKYLFEAGRVEEAMACCEDYMRQYPTSMELKFCVATRYTYNSGSINNEELAKKLNQRAIGLFEVCTQSENLEIKNGTYMILSGIYIQQKEFEKAKCVIEALPRLQSDPDGMLASLLIEEGKTENVASLGKVVVMRSWANLMNGFNIMANERRLVGECEEALQILQKQNNLMDAMEFDVPSRLQNHMNQLKCYAKAQKREAVLLTLQQMIEEVDHIKQVQEESEKNAPSGTIDLGMDALRHMIMMQVQYMKEDEEFAWIRYNEEVVALMKRLETMV